LGDGIITYIGDGRRSMETLGDEEMTKNMGDS
jgi:hypothetical protein